MSRFLLVSPVFHGYWRSIRDALARRGHEVSTVCYDAYDTPASKLRLKATVELPERLRLPRDGRAAEDARLTDRVIARVRAQRPERILVVKGDQLDTRFWEATAGIPRALWIYDELERCPVPRDVLRSVGPVLSYSHADADRLAREGVTAGFLPLAVDPHRVPLPNRRSGLIAFVGAGYPERRRLLADLVARGLPVHAWGRDFSPHPVDRLRTWSWRRDAIPASRDVPLERAYQIVGEAAAAVNMHARQDGHTMRTFEIPGMGGVQLVDRADVAEFYEPGREVAVFGSADELADLARRALVDHAWARGLREAGRRRTLAEHTFDHRVRAVEELMEEQWA